MRALISILVLAVAARASAQCAPEVKHCFPLAVWTVAGVDDAWVKGQLTEANARLAAIEAGVAIAEVHPLDAAHARIETRADRNALLRMGKQWPLRVFFVEHLADSETPTEDRKGVTWRGASGDFIVVVVNGRMALVLAHELGHVFGLPHSTEYRSIMNKTPRVILPAQTIYTPRELPTMRRMIKTLETRAAGASR